jgi:hypothetical protein
MMNQKSRVQGSSELEAAIPMMSPEELLVANEDTTFAEFLDFIEKVCTATE